MRRRSRSWLALWTDTVQLTVEAQGVIGLRLAKIALGGRAADAEGRLMATEKVRTAVDAQQAMKKSLITGSAHSIPSKTIRLYRRRVRSNLKRLARGK